MKIRKQTLQDLVSQVIPAAVAAVGVDGYVIGPTVSETAFEIVAVDPAAETALEAALAQFAEEGAQ